MGAGCELGLGALDDRARFAGRRMVRHDPLDERLRCQFGPDNRDLMDEQVRVGSVFGIDFVVSVPARGVRSTLEIVDGSGPQQPDPSTDRDAGVALVSPLSTALAC